MEQRYVEGGIYVPTQPTGSVRFAKVLAFGSESVLIRPYARPPRFRWSTIRGVRLPFLLLDPEPGDELAGPGVRILELSREEFDSWGPYFYANVGINKDEGQAVDKLVLSQIPVIPDELLVQLLEVEPSKDGDIEYRPCRVHLEDGTTVDRVQFAEAERYIVPWGHWPQFIGHEGRIVSVTDVVRLEESPYRLPAPLAAKMYRAGESAMGGCFFVLVLADGRRLPYGTGNVLDFLEFPPGVNPDDVVDLIPHDQGEGDVWRPEEGLFWKDADFEWCLYRLSAEKQGN